MLMSHLPRSVIAWLALAWASVLVVPWYWLAGVDHTAVNGTLSALSLMAQGQSLWLAGLLLPLALLSLVLWSGLSPRQIGRRRVGKECLRLCRSRWSPYH